MEEMSRQKEWPTSLRLVDNLQFNFGLALKPFEPSFLKRRKNDLSEWLLYKVKGYSKDQVVAATCLFEGGRDEVMR